MDIFYTRATSGRAVGKNRQNSRPNLSADCDVSAGRVAERQRFYATAESAILLFRLTGTIRHGLTRAQCSFFQSGGTLPTLTPVIYS